MQCMEPLKISQKRLVYNVHCCVKAKKRQPANIPTNPFLFKWTKVATAVHILGRLGPSQCLFASEQLNFGSENEARP